MIDCLRTCVRKQPINALYFVFETVLKIYNLNARCTPCAKTRLQSARTYKTKVFVFTFFTNIPDQMAPSRAIWSGCTLFFHILWGIRILKNRRAQCNICRKNQYNLELQRQNIPYCGMLHAYLVLYGTFRRCGSIDFSEYFFKTMRV